MTLDAHKNLAYSAVATAPSPADSGTSLVVTAGQGILFPAVPFNVTIWPANELPITSNAEIVRVTNISTDTFTITRTQEGTSARTIVVGDQIANTITAKTLTDTEDHGNLVGLTDDDHTQYALLAGRGTGQVLNGGVNSGNNLTLVSTAHATKGKILFGTSAYDEVNNRLGIGGTSPTSLLDVISGNNSIRNFPAGGGGTTPEIALGGTGVKSVSLLTGTNGSAFVFDDSGFFVITKDTTANIYTGVSTGGTELVRLTATGGFGIGLTPSAVLHVKAGTAAAGTAPFKLTSGTNLTAPEAGAMEYNGTSLFFTPGATRYNAVLNNLGLSGGQTLIGGTAASNNLVLNSTSNATKGTIDLDDAVRFYPSIATPLSSNKTITTFEPTLTINGSSLLYVHNSAPTVTFAAASPAIVSYTMIREAGTYTATANPLLGLYFLFVGGPTLTTATTNVLPYPVNTFIDNAILDWNNVSTATGSATTGFYNNATVQVRGSSGSGKASFIGFQSRPQFFATTAGGALNVTSAIQYYAKDVNYNITGTVTVPSLVGFQFDDHAQTSGNRTVTALKAFWSKQTAGTGVWGFYDDGGANHALKGNVRLGDNTAPTALLDLAGLLTMSNAGLVTRYNNVATVSQGIPSEVATIDTTGLTANVGVATLYAVPAAGVGMYRISAYVTETTAGSLSSTLPNVQIVYTDADSSTVITIDATPILGVAGIGQTGALTANTVGTTSSGVIVVYAKASTNIQYQTTGYASNLAGMAYTLRIKLEAL